jgi:hypothetical protein
MWEPAGLGADSFAALRNDKYAVRSARLFGWDVEEGGHFVVEEALAGAVGLDPFAVEDELGDGSLADVGDDEVGGSGSAFDIDLGVGDRVLGEEALGFAAVAAPACGVEEKFHEAILREGIR